MPGYKQLALQLQKQEVLSLQDDPRTSSKTEEEIFPSKLRRKKETDKNDFLRCNEIVSRLTE